MRFGSVCSGIEAASVAWHPLGWQAAWFSEIEPFPCAVLAHHYPEVPNHGDMTALPQLIRSGKVEAPDLFCGGTPCQAFSVAGLRRSLDDERGNLSLTFVEIADAIDDVRRARGDAECIVFWENVPGVLSTQDNAFGCFLGALAGCDTAIEPLAATGWTDAGVVAGPVRTVAWRVLDAQYFGLAQRRRRVFVVASAREGFDPAAVLLEWEGVRRDSAPSREAREGTARGAATGAGSGVDFQNVTDTGDLCGTLMGEAQKKAGQAGHGVLASTWCIKGAAIGRKPEAGPQHGEVLEESCYTLNCVDQHAVAMCLNAKGGAGRLDAESETLIPTNGGVFDVTHSLRGEGLDASEDGTGRGSPLVPVAQPYTLAIRGRGDSHNLEYRQDGTANALLTPNGGRGGIGVGAIAHAFDARQSDVIQYGDKTGPLDTDGHSVGVAVAFTQNSRSEVREIGGDGQIVGALAADSGAQQQNYVAQAVAFDPYNQACAPVTHTLRKGRSATGDEIPQTITNMQVRRLTPVECERLQGFPDDYSRIPWRGRPASECPDGPRYKALGNSWAVPCVRWIGRRIAAQIA